MPRPKILVYGIDGGTLSLVGPWARRGELPNLAKLLGAGASGALRSTLHPLTPQAWSSFLTGMNPGKHGVFDFGRRRPGSYSLTLTDSTSRRAPAIWSYLEEHDLSTGVVNLPLTFPLEPVHGFMVSGMHCPSLDEALGPRSLMADVLEVAPDYVIDVMSPWYSERDAFLADVHKMTDARGRLALHLYKKHRPDLFIVVMVAVDRVCHALYEQMSDPKNHNRDGRAGWKYSGEVLRAYKAVDRVLGDFLQAIDDDTIVVVMSDHGFGSLEGDVSLNQFFLERGLMSFSPEKVRPRIPVAHLPPGVHARGAGEALLHRITRALPPLARREDAAIRRGDIPLSLRRWEYIDWGRTVAYSHGLFGNVYINLEGREPEGCVCPADYERTRERVAEELGTLVEPEGGTRIVDHVFRREELYSGPFVDEAPDLVVVMRNYAYMTRGGRELTQTKVVTAPSVDHTGNHRLDGMLVLFGPGIRPGFKVTGANIVDVMPTILHLLQIPVPDEVDGRVLSEVLERPEHLVNLARKLAHGEAGPRKMSGSEEQLVRRRLKALGYFD
jgi:predicted AlkP superfamily phosphohydrolase/phosphomutase